MEVISRKINNVNYNLGASRVYNVRSGVKSSEVRINNTDVEQTVSIRVQYATSKTMTWSDSASTPSRISASMYASIPFVVGIGQEFKVVLPEERNLTVVFGKEQAEVETVAYETNMTIPPRKKVTISVTTTQAHCDVSFSYRVHDTLSGGTVKVYDKNDGLFTGANELGVTTNISEEDL